MQSMSTLDSLFLHVENEVSHMHLGAVALTVSLDDRRHSGAFAGECRFEAIAVARAWAAAAIAADEQHTRDGGEDERWARRG